MSSNVPDLKKLEQRFQGWSPAAPGAGRDRMLFEAGQAVARRRSRAPLRLASNLALLTACGVLTLGWASELGERRRAERELVALRSDFEVQTVPVTSAPGVRNDPGPRLTRFERPDPTSYLALMRGLGEAGTDRSRTSGDPSPGKSHPYGRPPRTLRVGDHVRIDM